MCCCEYINNAVELGKAKDINHTLHQKIKGMETRMHSRISLLKVSKKDLHHTGDCKLLLSLANLLCKGLDKLCYMWNYE